MATKRDLVEAHAFSRRRLVTAFVSGAPGGREVEPARPGRTIVGGLALAVLLVAGAAIAGVFAPRDAQDWNKPGLILSKETGAAYVILQESDHPVLRPVINITSARLILEGDVEPTLVSQQTIDEQTVGEDIGILGAPASLPTPGLLIDGGWTACTADGHGTRVDVADTPQAPLDPTAGFLVENAGTYYVIAQSREGNGATPGAYRFELPKSRSDDDLDNMLRELQLPIRESATQVPTEWLNLFPAGGALDFPTFGVRGIGDTPSYAGDPGVPQDARVGDVIVDGDSSLLLTADAPTSLDPFSLAVYSHTETPAGRPMPGTHRVGQHPWIQEAPLPTGAQTEPPFAVAHWPAAAFTAPAGDPCARLVTAPGQAPSVALASAPSEAASASTLPADKVVPVVDSGRGAYFLSGDWESTDTGSPFVVDAKGNSYPLEGQDAAARLGYGDHPVVVVPDSWTKLFGVGVPLSVDDALCRPHPVEDTSCL